MSKSKKKFSKQLPKKTRLQMLVGLVVFALVLIVGYFVNSNSGHKYLDTIELASQWFVNMENDEFIEYEYHTNRKYFTSEGDSTKKLGGLRVIAKAGNFLDNDELKNLAKKGLAYYEYFIDYDYAEDFNFVNVSGEKPNIAQSAYLILALLEMEHSQKDEYISKLANGILASQQESGRISEYLISGEYGSQTIYPGLALYALMEAYKYNGNEEYLDTVVKSYDYYSKLFSSSPSVSLAMWFSKAYNDLYLETKDEKYANFVIEMNDFVLKQNKPRQVCESFRFDAGIVNASYLEGVIAGYQSATVSRNRQNARCYQNFINEAFENMLLLQVTDTERYEQAAIGGFRSKMTDKVVNLDRSVHMVNTLIDAYEMKVLK